jgi:hypothetical protein
MDRMTIHLEKVSPGICRRLDPGTRLERDAFASTFTCTSTKPETFVSPSRIVVVVVDYHYHSIHKSWRAA